MDAETSAPVAIRLMLDCPLWLKILAGFGAVFLIALPLYAVYWAVWPQRKQVKRRRFM